MLRDVLFYANSLIVSLSYPSCFIRTRYATIGYMKCTISDKSFAAGLKNASSQRK